MSPKVIDPDPQFIASIASKKVLNLGSQLKRITNVLENQVQGLYDRHNKDFKNSWFPFLLSIKSNTDCDIKDLAELRKVSSSAASQVVKELIKEGLVESRTTKESRSKMLSITDTGDSALLKISPELKQIEEALSEILGPDADKLISQLDKLENAIKENPFYKRVPSQIKIESFSRERKKDFERLNKEWLAEDFELTEYDAKLLKDPQTNILDTGGEIFFAIDGDITVGTVALIHHSSQSIELIKMGVTKTYRGWGIGNLLTETCLNYAKENKYQEIFILTHSSLKIATKIYKDFGFKDMSVPEEAKAKYGNRADLAFRLIL